MKGSGWLSRTCECVYMYVYIYIYTYVCVCIYIYICMCVWIFMCMCMYVCIYIYTYVYTYLYLSLSINITKHIYIYICIFSLGSRNPQPDLCAHSSPPWPCSIRAACLNVAHRAVVKYYLAGTIWWQHQAVMLSHCYAVLFPNMILIHPPTLHWTHHATLHRVPSHHIKSLHNMNRKLPRHQAEVYNAPKRCAGARSIPVYDKGNRLTLDMTTNAEH